MPDSSSRLSLPFIQPAQAQKHVTHNQALQTLDILTQLTINEFEAVAPPSLPGVGEVFALGQSPNGAWSNQDGKLACWDGTEWSFIAPLAGWIAWDQAENQLRHWNGSEWQVSPLPNQWENLGINSAPDDTNRLTLRAPATLFSHEGNSHQLKINKASAPDTASLIFQSNWQGYAETGLSGSNDFSIKVSSDGNAWYEALTISPLNEEISMAPSGETVAVFTDTSLQLDVPITGTAVQASENDSTSGRLLRVGAFGLGTLQPETLEDLDDLNLPNGTYRTGIGTTGVENLPSAYGTLQVIRWNGTNVAQVWRQNASSFVAYTRNYSGGNWRDWTPVHTEYGSNSNGHYVKHPDGTMVCWRRNLTLSRTSDSILSASIAYPAAFISAPTVQLGVSTLLADFVNVSPQALGNSGADGNTSTPVVKMYRNEGSTVFPVNAEVRNVHIIASGRWK